MTVPDAGSAPCRSMTQRARPMGFAVADLDRDGALDIAIARSDARNVVYFGTPAATPSSACPRPRRPHWLGRTPRPLPAAAAPSRPDGLAVVYRSRHTPVPARPAPRNHPGRRHRGRYPDGDGLPQWVEDDFRACLRCGIIARGFAGIRCDACAAEHLVAFSGNSRGLCPSRNARRMVEEATRLTDITYCHRCLPGMGLLPAETDPPSIPTSTSTLSSSTASSPGATTAASPSTRRPVSPKTTSSASSRVLQGT
jgi:hypothetical protein